MVEIPEEEASFVVEADQSLVQAAAREGLVILTACEDGQCGTCVVRALEGDVDHRDRALTPEKRAEGWLCACVSRAAGPCLVLEL